MTTVLPIRDVRARLSELVDDVESTHERVIVTRNGRPAALLVSLDEWESITETLAVMSDPDAMRDIREGRAAYQRGETFSLDEVLAEHEERVRAHNES